MGHVSTSRRAFLFAASSSLALLAGTRTGWSAGQPRTGLIAAAASLRFVVDKLVEQYAASGGGRLRVSYGATGTLVAQIENGAPFEAFLAADMPSVKRLRDRGFTATEPRPFVRGGLSCVRIPSFKLVDDPSLAALGEALSHGTIRRLAIANPELAPYGAAARVAMQRAGVWQLAKPRLAIGENVAQAAQFVSAGAAQVGLISRSFGMMPGYTERVRMFEVSDDLYDPVVHGSALLKGAGPIAQGFMGFLQSRPASGLLREGGFDVVSGGNEVIGAGD